MSSQRSRGTGRIVAPHNHIVYRLRFILTHSEQKNALCGQDFVNPHRERVLRHKGRVLERGGIVRSRPRGEQRYVRRLFGFGVRFVESNVPVRAYSEYLDVRRMLLHRDGISLALRGKVLRHTVRDVRVGGVYVDSGKESVLHKPRKARFIAWVDAYVFVEIERSDVFIARAVALVVVRHLVVKRNGRGARSKPYHRVRLFVQHLLDFEKCPLCEFLCVLYYCESHNATSRLV